MKPLDVNNYTPRVALTEEPRVVEFIGSPAFRVVCLPPGPIVELADGHDSLGETRWVKALLVPDRRGLGEPVYEGWKEISQALGCSVTSAIRYARQRFNPLPVMYGLGGEPFIVRSLLRAWLTARCCSKHPRAKVARAHHAKRSSNDIESGLRARREDARDRALQHDKKSTPDRRKRTTLT